MNKKFIFPFFLLLVLSLSVGQAETSKLFDQLVTVEFKDRELGSVFQELSNDTGVKVIYDENLSKSMVSGSYREVPFLEVINRLLTGLNHSLIIDLQKNTLLVKSFGEAQYISTIGAGMPNGEYITDIGLPLADRTLLEKQSEEYRRQLENHDQFLDEVGMTRGELYALHEWQNAEFEQNQMDKEQYLADFKMTRGQLEKMREEQLAKFYEKMNNDKTVVIELGVTQQEHKERLATQVAEFDRQQRDDSVYISELGMTRGKHRRLLAGQMEKYRQQLTW